MSQSTRRMGSRPGSWPRYTLVIVKMAVAAAAAAAVFLFGCTAKPVVHPPHEHPKEIQSARAQQNRIVRQTVRSMCRHPDTRLAALHGISPATLRRICHEWGFRLEWPKPCPVTGAGSYQSCVQVPASPDAAVGEEITAGSGNDPGTPWMVTDPSGAPMAWVNLYGLYSGGDGGKMPGGLVCVTYGTTTVVACLTPQGTLQLRPAGPDGPDGRVVTLRARDIRFLHRLEAGR